MMGAGAEGDNILVTALSALLAALATPAVDAMAGSWVLVVEDGKRFFYFVPGSAGTHHTQNDRMEGISLAFAAIRKELTRPSHFKQGASV
jgi:hypothetical protein